jgi:hypothetical protein
MVVVGRETGASPVGHSTRLRGGLGSTFSQEQCIRPTLFGQHERLLHTGTARWKRTSGICGLTREGYVSCVSDFSYRMYINSNHRDSHI